MPGSLPETCEDESKIGLLSIWAIGVGSTIGGYFFGWQFVLYAGFVGAMLSLFIVSIFYWLYAGAVMDLAARFKECSGGAFDFLRNVMGPKYAVVMAILCMLKLVLCNAAVALAISSYLGEAGLPWFLKAPIWLTTYGCFTFLDCLGVKASEFFQYSATTLCLVLILFYCISSFTRYSSARELGSGGILPEFSGLSRGLPFALQFFDGFEEIPLLVSYAKNPDVTIPRALTVSYITIAIMSILILVSGAGISQASVLLSTEAPLMDGIHSVYGDASVISSAIAVLVVLGLLVNFFVFVVFSSQQFQAIAEAGFLPRFIALRHAVHGAPGNASIVASIIGVTITVLFALVFGEGPAQNTLVTASLVPTVLQYILVLECLVVVTRGEEDEETTILTGPLSVPMMGEVQDHRPGGAVSTLKESYQRVVFTLSQVPLLQSWLLQMPIKAGDDPGAMRFQYGEIGARVAQFMCLMFIFSLAVLAASSRDYFMGFISLGVLSTGAGWFMWNFVSSNSHFIPDVKIDLMNRSIDDSGSVYAPLSPFDTHADGVVHDVEMMSRMGDMLETEKNRGEITVLENPIRVGSSPSPPRSPTRTSS
jgi:ethanolamine permease